MHTRFMHFWCHLSYNLCNYVEIVLRFLCLHTDARVVVNQYLTVDGAYFNFRALEQIIAVITLLKSNGRIESVPPSRCV